MIGHSAPLRALLLGLLCLLSGCATLEYYRQGIAGQLDLLQRRVSVERLLTDPGTDPALRRRLARALEMRRFASERLGLPDNGSYLSYADPGREYVVWNVFATPELSLEPVESCFPLLGCLAYRGWFHRQDARRWARRLKAQGYDVWVAPVAAYSTLGWFDDPLLPGMLRWSDARLAEVMFHELAHQRLYLPGDTAFNEAFASVVAEAGTGRWLRETGERGECLAWREEKRRQREFSALVEETRARLQRIYRGPEPGAVKRVAKRREFERMRQAYALLKRHWGGKGDYDDWMRDGPNNARLAAVAIYRELVPGLREMLHACGGELACFYRGVEALAPLSPLQRRARLPARVTVTGPEGGCAGGGAAPPPRG